MGQTENMGTTSDLQSTSIVGRDSEQIRSDSSLASSGSENQKENGYEQQQGIQKESSDDAENQTIGQDKRVSGTVVKHPIFVGTAEIEVLTTIAKVLFEDPLVKDHNTGKSYPILDKDEFQLVSLVPEIFKKLNEQYLFELLEESEKERQRNVSRMEEAYHQAATQAVNLDEYIKHLPNNKKHLAPNGTFTHGQLKMIYNFFNIPMTNELVWTIIDFMQIKGFLGAIDLQTENTPREKIRYQLLLSDQQRYDNVKKKIELAKFAAFEWEKKIQNFQEEAANLYDKILKDGKSTAEGRDDNPSAESVVRDSASQ